MLQLTSYNRMLRYLSAVAGSPLTDSKAQKQMITGWILAASKQIENHLGRSLLIGSYTEYFNTITEKDIQFYVKAYPITTLTDVYIDGEGKWTGSESEVADCIINKDSNGVVLPSAPAILGLKSHRVRYVGGLASYGVKSVFTLSSSTGTWTANQFVYGSTSEAVGIIKSLSGTSLTVENLYGIFEAGETLTEYTDEDLTTIGDASATLSTISSQSLVEQYPDIVRAAEIQVRYYWKHKDDFEVTSTQKDATNQRVTFDKKSALTKEVMDLLENYVNHVS